MSSERSQEEWRSMGKKKLALKPVQRTFATTSVASKKKVEEAESTSETPETSVAPTPGTSIPDVKPDATSQPAEDWEDEGKLEEIALQGLVDRLHDKGEKEAIRIFKGIEYDKRLTGGYPSLAISEAIRDEVLQLAIDEESPVEAGESSRVKTLTPGDNDKNLLRLFTAFRVLQKLGFSEARITQCLLEGVEESDTWEEAIDWMWLHLSEDECLQRGEYAPIDEAFIHQGDNVPMQDAEPTPSSPPEADASIEQEAEKEEEPVQAKSMFTSHAASDEDDSDENGEPDMDKPNREWADLTARLDDLKVASGGSSKKARTILVETRDVKALKEKIKKVESDYMFSRKTAESHLKALRTKKNAEALAKRLQAPSNSKHSAADAEDNAVQQPEDPAADEGESDDGGMFGAMLDEPEPTETPTESTSTTIAVRSMALPRQFSYAGSLPKPLLQSLLAKIKPNPVIHFVRLSGASRAARAGLEILWASEKRQTWRMDEIACDDFIQAENYVALLALHELSTDGLVPAVNWKSMPASFRELWEELDVKRKDKDDAEKRELWKRIQDIMEKKGVTAARVEAAAASAKPTASTTDSTTRLAQTTQSPALAADFERRSNAPSYRAMREVRDRLPIAAFRKQIIDTLDTSQIMVLSGETGCGKSTQLPSFILEDQLSKGRPCKIFVTEPRRISAISLAQRVSQELGDPPGAMGTNSSLVGYSIRLEAKVSPSTRLAFVTNGIALRMLENGSAGSGRGTAFDEVTHIIIDEVHERSIESDFLLIVLKSLMEQRKDLKVVLMSATLDAEKISAFFGGCPMLQVPGRTFPVQVQYLEDAVQMTGWRIDEDSPYAIRRAKFERKKLEWTEDNSRDDSEDDSDAQDPTKLSSTRYSASTVNTVNLLDTRQIPYDLIVRLLELLCFEDQSLAPFSAATLVFMPGLAEIRKLHDALQAHPGFGGGDFVIYPLHSTISSEGQSQVFQIPPLGVRKIVISTNIAETGVTIPDITCVIDSGKHREMRYDEKRQISRLVETFIARSNAKQRRGRAGRVQEGLAFHLFTKARHDTQLAEHPIPEMLRLSLQDLALRIKILRVKLGDTIEEVLLKALDPPLPLNISRAISALVEVKALTANEDITPLGRLLSKLPMDVHLGKFLLVAAMTKCLDPALTIAATLNSKSPFLVPFGFESQADAAKKSFAVGNSDFLTIANAFASWRRASDNPHFAKTFCRKNYLSMANLQQIEELRQQLLSYLVDSAFVQVTQAQKQEISSARYARGWKTRFVSVPPELNVYGENVQILGAALASGLYPKLLAFDPSGGLKTITNQQPVSIHPSSVNFRSRAADFGTNYLLYFTIMQSKKLYAWESGPIDDRALVLLCGDVAEFKLASGGVQIDRRLRYYVSPKTSLALKLLREHFSNAMIAKWRGKPWTAEQEKWFDLGLKCMSTQEESGDRIGIA